MPNGKMHQVNPKTGLKYPPKHLSNYKKAIKLEEGLTMARMRGETRFKNSKKGLETSLRDHIGRMIDKMNPVDALIYGGVAYLGYDATKDWRGALAGVVGLKLATTSGGTPPVSQMAGLITLTMLGVASIAPSVLSRIEKQVVEEVLPDYMIEDLRNVQLPTEWWQWIPFATDIANLIAWAQSQPKRMIRVP